MHKNNDHRFAHQLIDKYHDSDVSLCVVVAKEEEEEIDTTKAAAATPSITFLSVKLSK